jgi:hypothetical protein
MTDTLFERGLNARGQKGYRRLSPVVAGSMIEPAQTP